MSINLKKGQKINLTKGGGHGLSKIRVGLGWDEVSNGFFASLFGGKKEEIDCDASVILCYADGKMHGNSINDCCLFFNNTNMFNGALVHSGDNLTGGSAGDDETIIVDLQRIPPQIDKMVFVVNIYDANVRNQHFGMVKNAYIRLVDLSNNIEICKFNLSENYDNMTGLIVAEIYRHNGEWKFNAIGQPVKEASRLNNIFDFYV